MISTEYATVCILVALGAGLAFSSPEWVLNHGPDASRVALSQGEDQSELGCFRIRPTGMDLTVTLPMEKAQAFAAEAFPFFALRYRMTTRQRTAGIFFTTDSLLSLSDKSYSPFPITGDGTWRHVVVDMRAFRHAQWKGTVTSFRLDPTNPSDRDSEIELSRLGFFPTAEAAEAFLSRADDRPDYTREVLLRGPDYLGVIPGGSLKEGWDRKAYLLKRETVRTDVPLTVCRDGVPVPSSVNSRGFAIYRADSPGSYTVEAVGEGRQAVPLPAEWRERFGCDLSGALPPAHFQRERIRIGGWGLFRTAAWDPAIASDFAECGFDLLIASGYDSGKHLANLLRAFDKLGVEMYVNDGQWSDPQRAGMAYFDHPSFTGHYLTDEPGTDAFARWGEASRAYHAATGKTPFINLLPMYANAAQLKFGAGAADIEYYDPDPALYRKYCERYCDLVPTSYICTDIYPLNWTQTGERFTYRDYTESINQIASVARERNREFWCCIQTFGWTPSKRTPNEAEFRWQCYAMLSFGCRGILCWVYAGYNPSFPSLVTLEGKRTSAWYDAKTVFAEIRKLSPVFCAYRNLGAFTHPGSGAFPPYLRMTNEYRSFTAIKGIACANPLLIGCFAAKDRPEDKAFTLVNMGEFQEGLPAEVKLTLDARNVTCYRRGIGEPLKPDVSGTYALTLPVGEGVFVTLD